MNPFSITLTALWIYPILSLIFFALTKKIPKIRQWVLKISIILTVLTILALLFKLSTISITVNWLLVSAFYLCLSLILWWSQFQPNKFLKITGTLLMIGTFGIGYLSGTLGILGVGFIVADFETDKVKKLDDDIIYKEYSIGNAISDYRGTRVEIYKTVAWLPVFEYQIIKKEYYNVIAYPDEIKVSYEPNKHIIYLSANIISLNDGGREKWSDSINLNKRITRY
ncbi:hypothetical protein SAMN04488511_109206 [Pedobacter suwonensis]|uniref:Uncharacterized protein n=1 Tax=Pedobacter suwonensis TaxID=332999 RepID=A0A1I0TGL9_9SPHI|nr:hypothetical protein [Pedobacter suwonensis]SFA50905.1 hypothetical protein SAMN04488511_109206 [Pedobacter suwonensis]